MREIQLTKGYVTIVDDEDYEYLCKQKWHAKEAGGSLVYACGKTWDPATKKSGNIKMHRIIMKLTDKNSSVDHIDGDGLNNRKSNLRICSRKENSKNQRHSRSGKWKGVSLTRNNRWAAYATDKDSNLVNLGNHLTAEKAAMAYNLYVIEHYGKFCSINMTAQYG